MPEPQTDQAARIAELAQETGRSVATAESLTSGAVAGRLGAAPEAAVGTSLDDVQRAHIQTVLRQCGWKVAGAGNAAERLGMKRGTLQFRMKKLGIRRPDLSG